jgi:hypothetical protein
MTTTDSAKDGSTSHTTNKVIANIFHADADNINNY